MLCSILDQLKFSIWGSDTCGVMGQRESTRGNQAWSFSEQLYKLPSLPSSQLSLSATPYQREIDLLCHLHGGDSHSVLYSLHHLTNLPALREEDVLKLLQKVPARDPQQQHGELMMEWLSGFSLRTILHMFLPAQDLSRCDSWDLSGWVIQQVPSKLLLFASVRL